MGSTKHEKTFVDFDRGYEQNVVGVRGVVYFGIGLLILIIVTFGLMYFLLNVMEENAAETKDTINPMRQQALEKNPDAFLPPEPRLQAAPGFGVDGPNGRVNLELTAPQSEWRELEKIWKAELKDGQKDKKTDKVITLGIDEAKEKFLQEGIKTRTGEQARKTFDESRSIVSYSSGGRTANEIRR